MTEKLEKEARFRTKGWKEQENCVQAYIAGAEPREKRIAELEAQIEKMKCCGNCKEQQEALKVLVEENERLGNIK